MVFEERYRDEIDKYFEKYVAKCQKEAKDVDLE
jgi:hypothetical protein